MSTSPAPSIRKSALQEVPFSRSLALALVLEALLLTGAASFIAQAKAVPRPAEAPINIVVDDLKPPPEQPPPPRPEKQIVRQPREHPLPQPEPVQLTAPAPPAPSIVAEAPMPETPHVVVRDSGVKEAEFALRLKAAIQAAVVYPAAARNMGFSGRARVEFQFRDGAIDHLKIIQSSGSGLIDQAALASVGNAVLPPIPDSLKGREMTYQVTVEFQLRPGR
jgi:protein TonB